MTGGIGIVQCSEVALQGDQKGRGQVDMMTSLAQLTYMGGQL